MSKFDAKKVKGELIQWISDWFTENGSGCNAVVGISGGVDSSVVAALCVEALGRDRVIGVLMPDGEQSDINMSYKLVDHLDIRYYELNIENATYGVLKEMKDNYIDISNQTTINLPARIRMATLYAVSQSLSGRVANTCNMSETYVGFDTKWGDSCGDFSPLANLTKSEVIALAEELGLPIELVHKTPQDGLTGKSDEESFGFTYAELDAYIRDEIEPSEDVKNKIDAMHKKNLFKTQPISSFEYVSD